jgi:uncharacterized protein YyaL (SSP411 family)
LNHYGLDNGYEGLMLEERIAEIIGWFEGAYMRPDGLPHYDVDGETGEPLSGRSLLSELGDYAPFLAAAGAVDFALRQVEILERRLDESPTLFRAPQARVHAGVRLPLPAAFCPAHIDSLDYTEIPYGLLELAHLTGEARLVELAESFLELVHELFARDGFIATWRLLRTGWILPVAEAMNGMFIEILADLHRSTRRERHLERARSLARRWLETPMYREKGIFPSVHLLSGGMAAVPRFRRIAARAELAKYNSSMAAGLLALVREDPEGPWLDELLRWYEGLREQFGARQGVFYHLSKDSPSLPQFGERPILSTNFAILDLLCELHLVTGEPRFLEDALAGAGFWLELQSEKTGLFPDQAGGDRSYLDANTDLIIALLRLNELSGEDLYRRSAVRCLKGILKHHHGRWGYVRDVDLDSGRPLGSRVETRFVSLLLKPLLVLHHGWRLYGAGGRAMILRDR